MKITQNNEEVKQKKKKKPIDKPKKEHVLVVAQEIKFARLLSGNEKKTRDRVLKTLKKWLFNSFQKGYEFKEDDFIRIWKGLFYAVWMSDKPLVQEDLCESIASILDHFPSDQIKYAILMVKAGFKVLAMEWYGIDHHRMDKYLMLVRRYLRGSLRCLQRTEWNLDSCQMYTKMLTGTDGLLCLKTPHCARNALSMVLHIVECFLEELSKVSEGDIPDDSLVELLRPFCAYMAGGETPTLYMASRKLLTELVRQSELGLRYGDATNAWKKMGCPKGGPEALELVSDDDEVGDEEEIDERNGDEMDDKDDEHLSKPLDPRAGRVHVILQPLPVPATKLVLILRELLTKTSSKAYRRVKICIDRFEKLSRSEYPLPVPQSDIERDTGRPISSQRSLKSLRNLEKNLVVASDELALRGLNRKHRKRLLAKARTGSNLIDEIQKTNNSTTDTANGDWQIETTEPQNKKAKNEENNKENVSKSRGDKKTKKRKLATANGILEKKQKTEDKSDKKATELSNKNINAEEKSIKKLKNKVNVLDKSNDTAKIGKEKNRNEVTNKVKNFSKAINNGESKETKKIITDKTRGKTSAVNSAKDGKNNQVKKVSKVGNKLEDLEKVKKHEKNVGKFSEKVSKTAKLSEKVKNNEAKPTLLVNKVKKFQKSTKLEMKNMSPKKVKFVLKNNSMQKPVDYYKSVRQSPNIPFDSSKRPTKTNLKPSTPSPINPFFKKKLRMNC